MKGYFYMKMCPVGKKKRFFTFLFFFVGCYSDFDHEMFELHYNVLIYDQKDKF